MRVSKDYRGFWRAESVFPLFGDRVLEITTRKSIDGLGTYASVAKREGSFMTFMLYQDYLKPINATPKRCTEKAVKELHAQALQSLETIRADALAHYQQRGQE